MDPSSKKKIDEASLDILFRDASSQNEWLDTDVTETQFRELHKIVKWGPTDANCCPMRITFVRSTISKEKLADCAFEGNKEKILSVPVTAIVGYDLRFHELMSRLMPIRPDIRDRYANDENLAEEVAFRNSSLQGAYFLIAICALSLDTGPLSGFDRAMVDQKFFPAGRIRSNFLLCIGNGRTSEFFSRLPRLGFDEICSFA